MFGPPPSKIKVDELMLLQQYLHECIDFTRPVSVDVQIEIWSKHGYIEEGRTQFMSFKQWKRVQEFIQ